MQVITNHVPRALVDAWELTPAERDEFIYLDWQAIEEGRDSASFVRYRGELYDLAEFTAWDNPASPTRERWDGMRSDSYFSGLVVRYAEDPDYVVVGRYYT